MTGQRNQRKGRGIARIEDKKPKLADDGRKDFIKEAELGGRNSGEDIQGRHKAYIKIRKYRNCYVTSIHGLKIVISIIFHAHK